MKVVSLSDYFVDLAEEICMEKFESDIMLIFNNFSKEAILSIVNGVKKDIRKLENLGIVFDNSLINTFCSMYLGLAWSMYRKGKNVQKEKKIYEKIVKREKDHNNSINTLSNFILKNKYHGSINDIALRYYTLYMDKYTQDILLRMDILEYKEIKTERILKEVFIKHLKIFGVEILAFGIYNQFIKEKN